MRFRLNGLFPLMFLQLKRCVVMRDGRDDAIRVPISFTCTWGETLGRVCLENMCKPAASPLFQYSLKMFIARPPAQKLSVSLHLAPTQCYCKQPSRLQRVLERDCGSCLVSTSSLSKLYDAAESAYFAVNAFCAPRKGGCGRLFGQPAQLLGNLGLYSGHSRRLGKLHGKPWKRRKGGERKPGTVSDCVIRGLGNT